MKKFTLSLFLFLFCFFSLFAQREQDSLALVKIYQATGGPQWQEQGNWMTSEPISNWQGVTVTNNRVTALRLSYQLRDSLPPEIGNLTALTTLNIYGNSELGGAIPAEIGNLTALTDLRISQNAFTGSIPVSFGNLKALIRLTISNCSLLSGNLPDTLGTLPNLTYLILRYNHFTGSIPGKFGNLSKLKELALGNNELSGSIPSSLGKLKTLETFDIENNGFSGALFPEIDSMSALSRLYLDDNNFTSLTDLSKLNHLRYVGVSGNSLDFEDLDQTNLDPQTVSMSYNNQHIELPIKKNQNGSKDTLKALYTYNSIKYQWNRDTNPVDTATDSVYIVPDSAIGVYDYDATSPLWPELTLHSKAVLVGDLHGGITFSDSTNLVDLYHNTSGDSWYDNTNWLSTEPVSRWEGVEISKGRVINLDLSENNLTGNLPSSIGNLNGLKSLNIEDNNLEGILPAELGNLGVLTALYLDNNQFSGQIPTAIGKLDSLKILDLTDNKLEGNIPSEVAQMTNLTELNLGKNKLTGVLPDLSPLTKLTIIRLYDNKLTGLSDLSSLKNLSYVNLKNNLFDYAALETAKLNEDSLSYYYSPQNYRMLVTQKEETDSITFINKYAYSGTLFQWTKDNQPLPGDTAQQLKISRTNEGIYICKANNSLFPKLELETTPIIVGTLHGGVLLKDSLALVAIYQSTHGDKWKNNTNWLSGDSVSKWHGVTVSNGRVSKLYLDDNQLTGKLPAEIGNLEYLSTLILWQNQLGDTLPAQIGNMKNLTGLYINNNTFTGPIPKSIGNLLSLKDLWLYHNQFSGNIPPELGNITGLQRLYAHHNQLTGTIPSSFGNLKKLYVLLLDYNNLSGSLPSEMTDMAGLKYFEINNNKLTTLGDLSLLPNLRSCYVYNNQLDFKAIEDTHLDWTGYNFKYSPQNLTLPVIRSNDGSNEHLRVDYSYTGVNYQWYKNDTLLADKTTDSLVFPVSDTGTYLCKVTCDSLPDLVLVSDTVVLPSPLGIINSGMNNILFYPNPTKGILNIRTGQQLKGIYRLEVLNLTGRSLIIQSVRGEETVQINLSDLSKGIYFIRISNATSSAVKKIIRE